MKVVVTMTSWKGRIGNCPQIVRQILANTLKPDALYLNLSEDEFPNKDDDLPKELVQVQSSNPSFHINWVPGPNTKPWKKVFPILKFLDDDDLIILVDDDMYVQNNLIQVRVDEFKENGGYAAITGGGCNPTTHLNIPLLKWKYNMICPSSILQKRMLNGYEDFLTDEIIETNHDDFVYSMLCLTNGFRIIPSKYMSVRRLKGLSRFGMHQMGMCRTDEEMVSIFAKRFYETRKIPFHQRLRSVFGLRQMLLVVWDSYDVAGDNGEYFYRRVRELYPEIRMVFLLSQSSRDWKRLSDDGFVLYPFQGRNVDAVLKKATFICFSKNIPNGVKIGRTLRRYRSKTVFLQHGVTYLQSPYIRNCISKVAKFICCTSDREALTIKKSSENVKPILCGFPRHDTLLQKSKECAESKPRTAFISFHWRTSGINTPGYLAGINQLLNGRELKELVDSGVKVMFLPHAMFMKHLGSFKVPEYIEVPKGIPFQDILVQSDVLVTDVSSNVFEMAYMGKPSISWFPEGRSGHDAIECSHVTICKTYQETCSKLKETLQFNGKADDSMERSMFKYVDTNNTRRLVEWLIAHHANS